MPDTPLLPPACAAGPVASEEAVRLFWEVYCSHSGGKLATASALDAALPPLARAHGLLTRKDALAALLAMWDKAPGGGFRRWVDIRDAFLSGLEAKGE